MSRRRLSGGAVHTCQRYIGTYDVCYAGSYSLVEIARCLNHIAELVKSSRLATIAQQTPSAEWCLTNLLVPASFNVLLRPSEQWRPPIIHAMARQKGVVMALCEHRPTSRISSGVSW